MNYKQRHVQRTNDLRIEQDYDGYRIQRKNIATEVSYFGLSIVPKEIWLYEKTSEDAGRPLSPFDYEKPRPFKVLSDAQAEMQRIKEFPKYYYK